MYVTLLIIHVIAALFLLGASTHQLFATLWPRRAGEANFVARYRGVNAAGYTEAIIVAFLITAALGSIIYPAYRIQVRPALEDLGDLFTVGIFELKEHFMTIAFGILPAYWYFWRRRPEFRGTRAMLTLFDRPVRNYDDARACDTDRYAALFRHLLERGIYVAPSQFEAMFVSLAHSDEDVDATVEAVAGFFRD